MLFSSMTFIWIFLPILLGVYFVVKEKYRNVLLLIFSVLFYSWGDTRYILVILISIAVNYIIGVLISRTKNGNVKKIFLIVDIIFNLLLLGYYKYFNFLAYNINELFGTTLIQVGNIGLPIGLSFYTFKIMSYIIDLYKNEIKAQRNIIDLALYVSFFPQLIAGPIVKYIDMQDQFKNRVITVDKFALGVKRFVYGLSKKVILANSLGYMADYIFNSDISLVGMPIAWLGALCYMLQIYFDFSGYSDMSIGISKMFGFEVPENFNLPYISQSITEFWRRWHISLSTWFKQYLYIPLGGNRKGKFKTYRNLLIVFFTTGLWHGAAWNFIAWGLYNGVFLVVERIKLKELLEKNRFKILNHIYAIIVIIVGWVLFRAPGLGSAIEYLKVMFNPFNLDCKLDLATIINNRSIVIIFLAIAFSGILQGIFNRTKSRDKIENVYKKYIEVFVIFVLMFICIIMMASSTYSPFIYLKF